MRNIILSTALATSVCLVLFAPPLAPACCTPQPDGPVLNLEVYDAPKFDAIRDHLATGLPFKFKTMKEVNDYVNKVRYRTDEENYGVADYWARPSEFFERGGDCEDYAIAKMELAIESGIIRPDQAHLVLVLDRTKENTPHALLIVNGLVYDCQSAHVYPLNSKRIMKRYKFMGEVRK